MGDSQQLKATPALAWVDCAALSSSDVVEALKAKFVAATEAAVSPEAGVPSACFLEEIQLTAQRDSGRCWMFAGLNVMRRQLMLKLQPDDSIFELGSMSGERNEFQFSQSHLVFFEKREKMHAWLLDTMECAHLELNDPLVSYLFSVGPLRDGSDWHVFRALVLKYGLVPRNCAPDTFHAQNTRQFCTILNRKAVEMGVALRNTTRKYGTDAPETKGTLSKMLEQTDELLQQFLGAPCESVDIHGKSMSPVQFYNELVRPHYDLSTKVGLVHDPTRPEGLVFTVRQGKNAACLKAHDHEYGTLAWINSSMPNVQEACRRSIALRHEAVWFGCDVGFPTDCDRQSGLYELDLIRTDMTTQRMTKQDRIRTGVGSSSHNMALTGYGRNGIWRAENSWGDELADRGYILISDAWFAEHVYGVVVDHKCITWTDPWVVNGLDGNDARLATLDPRDLFACI